jgi:hypothetical protein
MLRRIEIQPDDIGRVRFKRRVGRPQVPVEAMGGDPPVATGVEQTYD